MLRKKTAAGGSGAGRETASAVRPLARANPGTRVQVVELHCGAHCADSLAQRGVRVNEVLAVCHRAPLAGPVWVKLGDAMFAIGRGVAEKILVTELGPA